MGDGTYCGVGYSQVLEWMKGGTFTDLNKNKLKTSFKAIDPALLGPNGRFQQAWDTWSDDISESKPIDDVWSAFGDDVNAAVLVNTEAMFNGIKMQVWQGNNPMSDDTWKANGTGAFSAAKAISTIRAAIAIFTYLDSPIVHKNMVTTLNAMYKTFQKFDEQVNDGLAADDQIQTTTLFSEFIYYCLIPRIEGVQTWIERRVTTMKNQWTAVKDQSPTEERARSAQHILDSLDSLLQQAEEIVLISTSGYEFPPPELPSDDD